MRIQLQPPAIFFMHLPKAGGHTIADWIRPYYRQRYLELKVEVLRTLPPTELQQYRCYHSWHYGRGMLDMIGRNDLAVFTVLRDPVERDLSQLEHFRRGLLRYPRPSERLYGAKLLQDVHADLFSWYEINLERRLTGDRQTHILGTSTDYRTYLQGGLHADEHRAWPVVPPYAELPIDPDEQLREARRWLDAMAVVGLNERFNESMMLISATFGLPLRRTFSTKNSNPERTAGHHSHYRSRLNAEQIAVLEQANRRDTELYGHARERFERDWSRYLSRSNRTYSIAAYAGRAVAVLRHRLKQWTAPGRST